jgi:hypothetical protein
VEDSLPADLLPVRGEAVQLAPALHADARAGVVRPVVQLNPKRWNADVMYMQRLHIHLRRQGALIITVLAATDVAYRLLLRESVRRAIGMPQR